MVINTFLNYSIFFCLGNTYGMCVLQDFEALTPNLLARTIETVEGGGAIVLVLKVNSRPFNKRETNLSNYRPKCR